MIHSERADKVQEMVAQRRPFVLATVVRARRPTSVRPGDAAIVLSDGTIDGFVGGVCAASSVRLHSLRSLETGEPILLRLIAGDDDDVDAAGDRTQDIDGAVVEHNPCLSGGSLEIFLEPHLPAARLVIVGDSPTARALERVGQAAGYDCLRGAGAAGADAEAVVNEAAAVVVASHGSGEEAVLAAALAAGVPYVALVASGKRGEVVRSGLEIPAQLRAQLHTPAGLALGARSPEEIAISILAEMIASQYADPVSGPAQAGAALASAVTAAIDPVCGMRVAVTGETPQLRVGAESVFFCCEGCRDSYAGEHADDVLAP